MAASQAVLDEQRHLLGQTDLHLVGQICSLAEVHEILEREGEGDGFRERNGNVPFGLLNIGVWANSD